MAKSLRHFGEPLEPDPDHTGVGIRSITPYSIRRNAIIQLGRFFMHYRIFALLFCFFSVESIAETYTDFVCRSTKNSPPHFYSAPRTANSRAVLEIGVWRSLGPPIHVKTSLKLTLFAVLAAHAPGHSLPKNPRRPGLELKQKGLRERISQKVYLEPKWLR